MVIGETLLITYRARFGTRSHGILQMSATASLFHHPKSGKVRNPDESGNIPGAALSIFCTLTPILILLLKIFGQHNSIVLFLKNVNAPYGLCETMLFTKPVVSVKELPPPKSLCTVR